MSDHNLVKDMNDRFVQSSTVDTAAAIFIQHMVENRNITNASRMCAKDPLNLIHMQYLHRLFPNAKFVYLVRDARAVIYSLLSIEFSQNNGSFSDFKPIVSKRILEILLDWDRYIQKRLVTLLKHLLGLLNDLNDVSSRLG